MHRKFLKKNGWYGIIIHGHILYPYEILISGICPSVLVVTPVSRWRHDRHVNTDGIKLKFMKLK
jgi:hypothetical protein